MNEQETDHVRDPCSVSGDGSHRPDVFRMSAWLDGQLKSLGVTTKLVDLGKHVMDGQELPLPPAILGRIGDDPKKKIVLVYGHYDVQPVCLPCCNLSAVLVISA